VHTLHASLSSLPSSRQANREVSARGGSPCTPSLEQSCPPPTAAHVAEAESEGGRESETRPTHVHQRRRCRPHASERAHGAQSHTAHRRTMSGAVVAALHREMRDLDEPRRRRRLGAHSSGAGEHRRGSSSRVWLVATVAASTHPRSVHRPLARARRCYAQPAPTPARARALPLTVEENDHSFQTEARSTPVGLSGADRGS
jgi:hypothetical protein